MTKMKKVIAMMLALLMAFSSVSVLAFAEWTVEDTVDNELGISIDMYKEVDGSWVKTEKVKPGQQVKARVSLDTNYYSNSSDIKLYFDKDFFDTEYSDGDYIEEVTVNEAAGVEASLAALVSDGIFYVAVQNISANNRMFDGDVWLFEIPLTVKTTAKGEGKVWVEESDLKTPANQSGYINVPAGAEDGVDIDVLAMSEWELNKFTAKDGVVSTQSSITFMANNGAFATGDADKFVFTDEIGATVSGVPTVTREGYELFGWSEVADTEPYAAAPTAVPELDTTLYAYWVKKVDFVFDANGGQFKDGSETFTDAGLVPGKSYTTAPTEDDIKLEGYTFIGWDKGVPETVPYAESNENYKVTFTAQWALNVTMNFYKDEGDETALNSFDGYAGKEFGETVNEPKKDGYYFAGWNPELPTVYPEVTTDYYAVWEERTYKINFFVDGKFKGSANYAYDQEVYCDLPSIQAPYGYKLDGWHKGSISGDVFTEGTKMPDEDFNLYTTTSILKDLPAVFMTDETTVFETTYADFEAKIKLPEKGTPTKAGYKFLGWSEQISIMDDANGKIFYAVWEHLPGNVTYYAYNEKGEYEIWESFDIEYGEYLESCAEPYMPGYVFMGWAEEGGKEEGIFGDDICELTMGDEEIAYYEARVANSYTVNFNVDGGTDVTTPQTVKFGEKVVLPSTQKTGNTLSGWKDEEGNLHNEDFPIPAIGENGASMTLTAVWEVDTYKIYFYDDDKTTLIDSVERKYNTETDGDDFPEDPTREGYTFDDWYDKDGNGLPQGMPANDIYVYAKYDIETYTISFNGNGCKETLSPITAEYGEDISALIPKTLTKDDYEFEYWYVHNDESETEYEIESPMADLGDDGDTLTLDAKWTPKQYTITFVTGEGASTVNSITAAYNSPLAELEPEDPTRTGYDFGWWYLDDENTPFLFQNEKMPSGGATLNAKWNSADGTGYKVVTYTMDTKGDYPAEDAPEGEFKSISPRTGETDEEIFFDDIKPVTKKGFKLDETKNVVASKKIAADGSMVFNIYVARESYDLTVVTNSDRKTNKYFFESTISEFQTPTDADYGYEFKYWYSDNEAEAFNFTDATMPNEALTLTAKYAPKSFAAESGVVFDANGGEFSKGVTQMPVAATFGSTFTAPKAPTQYGYKFEGWSTDEKAAPADAIAPVSIPELAVDLDVEDLIYYAVWSAEKYTGENGVLFDANGGEFEDASKTKYADVTFNEVVTAPGKPIQTGYEFAGWMASKAQGSDIIAGPEDNLPKLTVDLDVGDVTYYAAWTAEKYTGEKGVKFVANGGKFADDKDYIFVDATFGEAIQAPAEGDFAKLKPGYKFDGWSDSNVEGAKVLDPIPALSVDLDDNTLTYYAVWSTDGDVDYTVSVHVQKADGTGYEDSEALSTVKSGVADTEVTYADAISGITLDDGFVFDAEQSETKDIIDGDGTMVFDIYVNRETYTATFNAEGYQKPVEVPALYGAEYTVPTAPEKEGYRFDKWLDENGEEPSTMPLGGASYTATYEAKTYMVRYFIETADGKTKFYDRYTAYGDEIETTVNLTSGYEVNQWFTDEDYKTPLAKDARMGDGPLDLYGKETAIKYTVTFDANGGEFKENGEGIYTINDVTIEDGNNIITAPQDPTRKNYIFSGWDTEVSKIFSIPGNVTYTATWKVDHDALKATYMIHVDETDKSKGYKEYESYPLGVGDNIETPIDPYISDDYEFLGWATQQNASAGFLSADDIAELTMGEEDVVYYGEFKYKEPVPNQVVVNFNVYTMDVDGAYVGPVPDACDALEGETVYASSYNIPNGFELNTNKSDESVTAADGATLNIYIDRKQYKIEYYFPGTPTRTLVDTQYVYYGKPIELMNAEEAAKLIAISSDDSIKYGKEFKFWDYTWTNTNMPATNLIVTASFSDAEFTVKFVKRLVDENGKVKDSAPESVIYNYGNKVEANEDYTKEIEGYSFTEWKTSEGYSMSLPFNIGKDTPKELTLYAVHTINEYTIRFFYDSAAKEAGTPINTPVKLPYGTDLSAYVPVLDIRTGYKFDGWADIEPISVPAEDTDYVGQWTVLKYAYRFVANGKDYSAGTADYGTDISTLRPEINPTSDTDGLYFAGWSTREGGAVVTNLGKISDIAEDNIFYAVFSENLPTTVTVTFYDYDGSNEHGPATGSTKEVIVYDCAKSYDSGEVNIGEAIKLPEAPTLKYYKFVGWFDKDGKEWTSSDNAPEADLELYAKYVREAVALIPVAGSTTIIERGDKDHVNNVADAANYVEGSEWYVYGLKIRLRNLDSYITVTGDGRFEIKKVSTLYVGTGSVISVYDNVTGELIEQLYVVIYGDLNGDGMISATDSTISTDEIADITNWRKKEIGRNHTPNPNYCCYKIKAANVSGDDFYTATDASILEDYAAQYFKDIDQQTGMVIKKDQ